MSKHKALVCPYCGYAQHVSEACRACGGRFDPDSRRATRAEMGPWFMRDPAKPFRPGCSLETVRRLVAKGRITKYTILRGPTTRQFWTVARRVPGIAHLLGYCHACDAPVDPADTACARCRATFDVDGDRDRLGVAAHGQSESPDDGFSIADLLRPEALRAGSPRGGQISAFVDDEMLDDEMLEDEMPNNGMRTNGMRKNGESSLDRAVDERPTQRRAGDDAVGRATLDALERSLRRTVERQRQTIQFLVVATILLALAVLLVLVLNRGAGPRRDTEHREPAAAPASAKPTIPSVPSGSALEAAEAAALPGVEGSVTSVESDELDELAAELDAVVIGDAEKFDATQARLDELKRRLDATGATEDAADRQRIDALLAKIAELLDQLDAQRELRRFFEGG